MAVGEAERILVSVRLRPVNAREAERGDGSDWECAGPTTLMFRGNIPERAMFPATYAYGTVGDLVCRRICISSYSISSLRSSSSESLMTSPDRVFNPECNTQQVYEQGAKRVAMSVLNGINSSIFAYGQTSSGKTYTMVGVTEHSMSDIYDYIDKHPEREFVLKFSAMEIYNEAVRDLLNPEATQLRLLDDPECADPFNLVWGTAQRQIGETALNETSSRSHQILRLTIESSAKQFMGRGNSSTLMACVNFVDLAGSERASQTQAAGTRLKEGSHINRSLLTLGKVIRQLSKGGNGHIPYRDSKLTRILQSSLGGNARTAIICTMSPAHCHLEQSRNTLLFANCAKNVATNAQVNVVMSDKLEEQLKDLMEQRDTVQSQLENFRRVASDGNINDRTTRQWYTITEDFSDMKNAKDIGTDIAVTTVESPRWPIDFKKKQKEIIELWHDCNVSIVHRTYFFLLFKGDNKADNIYLEVEQRRLSFIKSSFSAGCESSATVTSSSMNCVDALILGSLRNLRHERDMLYRQMLRKLQLAEREIIYTKWGIDVNSKQRRLQLSRRIWTQTDMEHVRESAALVAKLVEHLEKGQAIKEMFGLSFTLNPRGAGRNSTWRR
nr:unnamed protein product [Digitaria exilis]